MSDKRKGAKGDYEVGKGRPPKASRWRKGKSGNPKGRTKQPPDEAELIDRLFRRRFTVIEGEARGEKIGFAIIHAQLLIKESSGQRRAGRIRDRYEAFARSCAGVGEMLLRFVNEEPASIPGTRVEPASANEGRAANGAQPRDAKGGSGVALAAGGDPNESKS